MQTLNLHRIWEILNRVTEKQDELHEKDSYIYLLNSTSYYIQSDFENFINYFCFRIEGSYVTVFNNDGVPYEDYNNDDVFYVPKELLEMNSEELDVWIEDKTQKELDRIERDKFAEKEKIKADIERLTKQLEKL